MPTDNEWEQRVLDRQTGYTPPIPAVDQPEPRREHCRDCAGSHVSSTGDYSECPGLAAPSPEAAGLREAVEKFLRRWDDPERYHPIPAVDDLRAALAAPEAAGLREALVEAYRALDRAVLLAREPDPAPPSDAGLRELADEIAKDWNGRPDVCPRCGHSSIGCLSTSQATPEAAGLRDRLIDAMEAHSEQRRGGEYPHLGQSNDIRQFVDWLMDFGGVALATPSQADRGLDAAVLDAVFAELNQRGWITVPDGHGVAAFRDVFIEAAARLQDSIPDSSSQETE